MSVAFRVDQVEYPFPAKLAKEANEDSIRIAARLNNTLSENAQAKRSAFTLPLPAQAKADKNESRMSA